jgi:hypothetical protein
MDTLLSRSKMKKKRQAIIQILLLDLHNKQTPVEKHEDWTFNYFHLDIQSYTRPDATCTYQLLCKGCATWDMQDDLFQWTANILGPLYEAFKYFVAQIY